MNNSISDEKILHLLIRKTNKTGGATADMEKKKLLVPKNAWFFPKYSSKTKIIPLNTNLLKELETFVNDNKGLFLEKNTFLGVWLNPNTQHYYLDVTTSVEDLNFAKKTAKEISIREGRKIVTLYNPKLNKTVYLWEDVRS